MKNLKNIARRFLIGNKEGSIMEDKIRIPVVINAFLYLMIAVLLYYSILWLSNPSYTSSIGAGIFMLINIILLIVSYTSSNYKLVGHIFSILTTILSISVLTFLDIDETNLIWLFVYPFVPFFVFDRKIGLIYVLIFYAITYCFLFFTPEWGFEYPVGIKKTFIKSFTIEIFFIFIFQTIRAYAIKAYYASDSAKNELLTELKAQKEHIGEQKTELESQNKYISMQNRAVTESINYGLTIQQAILPDIEDIKHYFDAFLFYKPKDIVSGDFVWLANNCDYTYVAVIDCTGHGVPGAFLSLIGTNFLNEIIAKECARPKDILHILNNKIIHSLRQQDLKIQDGMDVCLLALKDISKGYDAFYAGAKRPLIYFDNVKKEVKVVKGVRKSIGGVQRTQNNQEFEETNLFFNYNDVLYLTSDGFIDQHNSNRKKFGTPQLLKIIENIASNQMSNQIEVLASIFMEWQGDEQQTDDVTILGLKLNK